MRRTTPTITRRLTTAFALVMAVVLVVGGIGIYFGERFSLDRNLDRELRRQSDELRTLVRRPGQFPADTLEDRPDSYLQLLNLDGTPIASTPPLQDTRLLTRRQVDDATRGQHTFERGSLTSTAQTFRIHTARMTDAGRALIAVSAVRRDSRDEALRELLGQLLLFGSGALAISILVGYRLTRAAMEPVEALRRQADEIHTSDAAGPRHLVIPRAGDEIERLATTLSRMLDRIDRTVQRERTFAATAGHELRTPLAALTAEIDLALRGNRSADELTEALRLARVDTERLTQLAEDLLLFSRIASGELERSTFRLSEAADDAVTNTHVPDDRSLIVRDDTTSIVMTGSKSMMQRAICNLLDNAIRHGRGTIELRLDADFEAARISVRDEGPGIEPQFVTDVFEPFTRAAGRPSGSGAGLGLALVRQVAETHHGTAIISNHASGRFEVTISVPLAPTQ
ncbi:MAG: hypothetical protein JWM86_995 [Thermoleophilia bacterium]|nr:hypothetical protein [Thermoleophilia bacterium]